MQRPAMLISTFTFFLLLTNFFADCQQLQDHFIIQGSLSNLKDKMIYLQYIYGDSTIRDSAVVTNGNFTFTGKLTEPVSANLILKDYRGYAEIFIENAKMNLRGDADDISNVALSGSSTQDQNVLLIENTRPLDKEIGQMYTDYETARKNNDSTKAAALSSKIKEIEERRWEIVKKFIAANPKSYVSLGEIWGSAYSKNYNDLFQLYSMLDKSIQQSRSGIHVLNTLNKIKKISAGSMAMDFIKNDVNGKPVKLSDYRGKWVLLDFWASWCGPCRAENPNVLKNYNAYKDKGFTVLGVSLDDSASKWKKAIAEDKMPWDQVCSFEGWVDPVAREYYIYSIPSNFLIDPKGVIVARNLRREELGSKLKEVIGQ